MRTERGMLYVATGERAIRQVRRAVRSLRVLHPGLPVTLFTDGDVDDPNVDEVRRVASPMHDWRDKVEPMLASPYERTVFLDADTFVCASLYPVFALLDRFELAVAHHTVRLDEQLPSSVPASFPALDTGVVAYRLTEPVRDVLRSWLPQVDELRAAHAGGSRVDGRHALRELLWERDVRFAVLPPEYDLQIARPAAVAAGASVTVLRGDEVSTESLAARVGRSREARVVLPDLGHLDRASAVVVSPRGDRLLRWSSRLLAVLRRRRRDQPST